MARLISIIWLFFCLSSISTAQTKINSEVHWLNFEQLSDSLAVNQKKVILFFHTDWCVYCKKMMKEGFQNQAVIDKLNKEYYAVHFDAESTDSIRFDNQLLTNSHSKKKRGQYHQLTQLLFPKQKPIFPTIFVFDNNFNLIKREQKYLSTKELLIFL